MSTERLPGELFDQYKARQKIESKELRNTIKGRMFFLASGIFKNERTGELRRFTKSYIKPK